MEKSFEIGTVREVLQCHGVASNKEGICPECSKFKFLEEVKSGA